MKYDSLSPFMVAWDATITQFSGIKKAAIIAAFSFI